MWQGSFCDLRNVQTLSSGAVTLNLGKMPRPTKDVKKCNLKLLKKDGTVPTLNLFKQKKVKGWWPMAATNEGTGEEELVVS